MSESKLIQCFVEALGVSSEVVKDDLTYNSIPQWDSVAHMTLVSVLEDNFEIMLDTDDIIDMSSFLKAKEILAKYNVSI